MKNRTIQPLATWLYFRLSSQLWTVAAVVDSSDVELPTTVPISTQRHCHLHPAPALGTSGPSRLKEGPCPFAQVVPSCPASQSLTAGRRGAAPGLVPLGSAQILQMSPNPSLGDKSSPLYQVTVAGTAFTTVSMARSAILHTPCPLLQGFRHLTPKGEHEERHSRH
jgi:hypothetical protein